MRLEIYGFIFAALCLAMGEFYRGASGFRDTGGLVTEGNARLTMVNCGRMSQSQGSVNSDVYAIACK